MDVDVRISSSIERSNEKYSPSVFSPFGIGSNNFRTGRICFWGLHIHSQCTFHPVQTFSKIAPIVWSLRFSYVLSEFISFRILFDSNQPPTSGIKLRIVRAVYRFNCKKSRWRTTKWPMMLKISKQSTFTAKRKW